MSIYTIFPTLDPMHTNDDGSRGGASDGETGPSLDDITRSTLLTTPSSVARDDLANTRGAQDDEYVNSLEFSPTSSTINRSDKNTSQYPALEQPALSARGAAQKSNTKTSAKTQEGPGCPPPRWRFWWP